MRKKMTGTENCASRICLVLGNPDAYQVVKFIGNKRPSEITNESGMSFPQVSLTLRTLKNIDLLRYETKGAEKI